MRFPLVTQINPRICARLQYRPPYLLLVCILPIGISVRKGDVRFLFGSHIISRQRDMLFACCACVASAAKLPRTLLPSHLELAAYAIVCPTPSSHVLGKPYSAVIVPPLTIRAAFPAPVAHGTYFHIYALLLRDLSLRRCPRSCI
jgi:hypothetical protein